MRSYCISYKLACRYQKWTTRKLVSEMAVYVERDVNLLSLTATTCKK